MSLVCFYFLLLIKLVSSENPVVETAYGKIQGSTNLIDETLSIESYLGIRFAEPPIGILRFQPPVDVTPWTGTYAAVNWPPSCPYVSLSSKRKPLLLNDTQNEDCLFLNVWTTKTKPKKAPVLVFIYGGAFAIGTSSDALYNGALLAASQYLVVVSFNYRLNALGFLYLDDELAPGNVALMDQLQALKWVSKNIEQFGGDPDQVTIMGQSAGAASVGFHLTNPESRAYFLRAVLLSGSAASSWASESKVAARDRSLNYASSVGCVSEKVNEVLSCLREKNLEELMVGVKQLRMKNYLKIIHFQPVVDGKFIRDDPTRLLVNDAAIINKNVVIGFTSDDGAFLPHLAGLLDDVDLLTPETFLSVARGILKNPNDVLLQDVKRMYLDCDGRNDVAVHSAMVRLITDYMFLCNAELLARTLSTGNGKVYYFQLQHRPTNSLYPDWLKAVHSEDLIFTFGHPLNDSLNFSAEDRNLAKVFTSHLGNFVKFGDPNPTGTPSSKMWFSYEKKNQIRMDFEASPKLAHGSLRPDHCAFWQDNLLTIDRGV